MDKINLLIFDVDGTLVDSLCGATASVNVILARNGRPQVAARDVATYINHGGEHFISHAAATEDPAVIARLLSEFTQEYHDNCWAPPYEGVLETLEVLQKRGKTLGVYSNKMISVAQKQMELIRADALLDFICADDGNTVLKPKPDAILQMLRRTGCPPGKR